MDRDIPIPQEVLDAEAPCDCGYPMSAHQRPDWFCCDWRKKHDELAELAWEYLELKCAQSYFFFIGDEEMDRDIWEHTIAMIHNGLECYLAALRKAVEGGK
jgi:hypothetical protein